MYLIVSIIDNSYRYQHCGIIFSSDIEDAEEYFKLEDAKEWVKIYSSTNRYSRELKVVSKTILLRKEKLKKLEKINETIF